METMWIFSMWGATIVGLLLFCLLAEGLFWCFSWCFCKLDDYFRERHFREAMENLARLERIAEKCDKVA